MRVPSRRDLSDEQRDIFENAPLNRVILITGPPGTGKTVIAIYRAWLLEKQKKEYIMVMHSAVLDHYTGIGLQHSGIDGNCRTWHKWIWGWWKNAARKNIPQVEPYRFNYREIIKQLVTKELKRPEQLNWGHLIIDEGQDFPAEFYTVCRIIIDMYMKDLENGYAITLFADENQRMDEENNASISQIRKNIRPDVEYTLTENFRSTREIAKLSAHFYVGLETGKPLMPEKRHGKKPVLKRFNSLTQEVNYFLRYAGNNDDQTVGIIVPNINMQNQIVKALKDNIDNNRLNIQMYNSRNRKKVEQLNFAKGGTITVLCDSSCKGLEFDTVFIPQLQTFPYEGADEEFFKMKMYVMTSRARLFLALTYSECENDPAILDLLPAPDMDILIW